MALDAKRKTASQKQTRTNRKGEESRVRAKDKRASKAPKRSRAELTTERSAKPAPDSPADDRNSDINEPSDTEHEEVSHSNLLRAIQSMDGKKAPINQRNEASSKVSEFHHTGARKVELSHLLQPLQKSETTRLKKTIKKKQSQPSQTLEKPQDKLVVNRAERQVVYDQAKQEVHKWETVVEEIRTAPHMEFPLNKPKISIQSIQQEARSHQPRNALELEIQAVLNGPDYVARLSEQADKPVLTRAEQRAQKAMDLEAAREDLALRRKHRSMVADLASKNKRQNKIKSRNYRRHLKASRRKEAFKALEKLKQENPELWKEKAEELERARIEERATLRHKGKGKFTKLARRYGKYNEKIKDSLDEMRSKGVELLQKQAANSSSESDAGSDDDSDGVEEEVGQDFDILSDESDTEETSARKKSNPWMSSKLRKEEKPASPETVTRPFIPDSAAADEAAEAEESSERESLLEDIEQQQMDADELLQGQSAERIQTLSQVESFDKQFLTSADASAGRSGPGGEEETTPDANEEPAENGPPAAKKSKRRKKSAKDIDPDKVIVVPSTDLSSLSHADAAAASDDDDDADDAETAHRMNIAEAFADDDVVAEFNSQKKRAHAEQDEKDSAAVGFNVMPGWGFWSGAGMREVPKRRNLPRRLRARLSEAAKAKAKLQEEREKQRRKYPSGVIVNEEALRRQPVAAYQVSKPSLPASTFKSMMSYPVGRDFVPTLAHNEMVRPKVHTALGKIIEPMDKEEVLDKMNRKRKRGLAFDADGKNQRPAPIKQYQLPAEASKYLKQKKLAKNFAKANS